MKKIFLLASVCLFILSCSEDFKVGADYKEVTIIYGLLDDGATANYNYIKITRGFFSEKENNLLYAKEKDSVYFEDLSVKIEERRNGALLQTYTCNKLDLNTILTEDKQQGVFLDTPNIGYQLIADLNPLNSYKLVVTNNKTGKVVTGETKVISVDPAKFKVNYPFTTFDRLDFADPTKFYTFDWNSPDDAVLFDIVLRFKYYEKNVNTNVEREKFVDLPLGRNITYQGTRMNHRMENKDFYSLLTGSIGSGGIEVVRYVDTPILRIIAGGFDLKQYIDVNSAQGGLTSDQIKPIYTNLIGENALGIFSTRATRTVGDIAFSESTFDSIINSKNTKSLNFIGRSSR